MAEEELTPYQNWTAGELKAEKGSSLDLGLRDRAARDTAPGATLALPKTQSSSSGVLPVAGETREQRELRSFLASGEAKSQLEAFKKEKPVSRPGSERPGSQRPGSERPGSQRDLAAAGARPASERNLKPGVKAPAGPNTEKSKRKAMFDKM